MKHGNKGMAKNVGPAQTPTGGQKEPARHGTKTGGVPDPAFVDVGNNRGPCGGFDGGAQRRKA